MEEKEIEEGVTTTEGTCKWCLEVQGVFKVYNMKLAHIHRNKVLCIVIAFWTCYFMVPRSCYSLNVGSVITVTTCNNQRYNGLTLPSPQHTLWHISHQLSQCNFFLSMHCSRIILHYLLCRVINMPCCLDCVVTGSGVTVVGNIWYNII